MVKKSKKDSVTAGNKETFEETKKRIETLGRIEQIKDKELDILKEGNDGELKDYEPDFMLVFREKDGTWYYGSSRILDNDNHQMNGMKVYEVKDFDRTLEDLRARQKFDISLPNMIIWKDYDNQDELVGWADPYA